MASRRVNIVRNESVADQEELRRHPNVRGYLQFPWDYTVFEFYDPVFDQVASNSKSGSIQSEETRRRLTSLMSEERRLLWPIYKGRPARWQGNQLVLFLTTGTYRVLDRKKTSWPFFGSSAGWEVEKLIKIVGRARHATAEHEIALETTFREWLTWAKSASGLAVVENLNQQEGRFTLLCSFDGSCSEACIGLYLLIARTQKLTLVEAIGFFTPEETSPAFFEIGGSGVLR